MNLRRAGKATVAAFSAWTAFAALVALRLSGVRVSPSALVLVASIAMALAFAECVGTVFAMWRGPTIVTFSRDEAEICGPDEAEAIRAAAKLRGTLGGAGHIHSARLILPALAWLAATALAAGAIVDPALESVPGWPAAVVAVGVGAAALFPATPFYYREAVGGRVVVHPPSARAQLVTPVPKAGAGATTAVSREDLERGADLSAMTSDNRGRGDASV
jgi:hypothetical protein